MRQIDKNSPEYDFVRQLLENISCVVCSAEYDEEDVAIMSEQDELWMLMVCCHHCETQGIILAMLKDDEHIELLTDLTAEELEAARDLPALSGDDVLDICQFVRDFDGDFVGLFKEDLLEI